VDLVPLVISTGEEEMVVVVVVVAAAAAVLNSVSDVGDLAEDSEPKEDKGRQLAESSVVDTLPLLNLSRAGDSPTILVQLVNDLSNEPPAYPALLCNRSPF
jgi:hypothetical protein